MKLRLISIFYRIRHLIALFAMLVGLYLIKSITELLYLPAQPQKLTLFSLFKILWSTNDVFLRFIVIINFLIKPVFIYIAILLLLYALKENSGSKKH
ncbi:Uncharacterised protein [Legionella lansingensis]|uniref:Uncharacterized protein n=1 Tax=Legionella lansingensis TaxID=45067 RepID=A0A0W0VU33_9GAMM|nr:hypothetical protein [Legionella lansingensis]KTD23780.1 hypothetical protein Llan_0561 [Legionella lansingensis]SNV47335.1 Uncharacterised protein [Legionella lansingensis]